MIIVQDPKTYEMIEYRSLMQACKWNRELKYYTLKSKKLSNKPTKYKNVLLFRINYY